MDNGLIFPYRLVTVKGLTSSAKQTNVRADPSGDVCAAAANPDWGGEREV